MNRPGPFYAILGPTTIRLLPPIFPRPGSRVSNNAPHRARFSTGKPITTLSMPVDLSYQVDVWGRVRRTVESYREQAQASAADLATVNLSLHADLAIDYFEARSLDAEEQLLNLL